MDEGTEVLENLPSVDWVRVSDFTDGDICVLRFDGVLPLMAIERLRQQMSAVFAKAGTQISVIVLEEGAQIEMLRRAQPQKEKARVARPEPVTKPNPQG
jgi:hypothetical protein